MKKPFIVANVREITDAWDKGEITYSRMVEMLNEIAEKFYVGRIKEIQNDSLIEDLRKSEIN
jgi:septation ring formation regulator EzrA